MKKTRITVILLCISGLFAGELTLKEQALEAFQKEHYDHAIVCMEQALEIDPNDPEIYYYLGYFNHYRASDSRPLSGHNQAYSDKILNYLTKALELDPDYGDAKYFYGAECGANAFIALQQHKPKTFRSCFKKAYDIGAYPSWLLEFGKNMLQNCDRNAILFTGGDADFGVCTYLQLYENLRTDITILPVANIGRPWYMIFMKEGRKRYIRPIRLTLDNDQIMNMHPFKWDTTDVVIPYPEAMRENFHLSEDHKMCLSLSPDLFSERQHTNIYGRATKGKSYLSPQHAMLLQIVEDNYSERPIFFSNMAERYFFAGLHTFFRNRGLVSELLPFETSGTIYEIDYEKIDSLLQEKNLKDYPQVLEQNIPRISNILFNYHINCIKLADHYMKAGKQKDIGQLKMFYDQNLAIGFNPQFESRISAMMENMTKE